MILVGAAMGVSIGFLLGLLHAERRFAQAKAWLDRANATYDRAFAMIDAADWQAGDAP
ncbi:hypothetical protein GI582_18035 [Sulfitobacter sp. BDSS02]|nr:hypothetical protein [Sulfitobacter sp. BDSS02]MBR9852030.1 hypothetical protein [Paracoccaceae bacterium]